MIEEEIDLATTEEAAKILRLSPGTLANLRSKNSGPPYLKYNNRCFYKTEDLLAYMESRKIIPKGCNYLDQRRAVASTKD